jgi:8-oxo-dGTP pyrophosphatase MutT (NUDIX family)
MQKFIQILQARLEQPLPGEKAQRKMLSSQLSGEGQNSRFKIPENHKRASVLALFYPKNTGWHLALMQRPESPYAHSRQISFPGGGAEEHDIDEAETALRETEEEFGIPKTKIEILGRLTHVYIPVSNYLVHPFVGYLREEPLFNPDLNEVEEIVEVPLTELLDPANRKRKEIEIHGGLKLQDIPYFHLSEKVIWGATAMMLGELTELMDGIEWP